MPTTKTRLPIDAEARGKLRALKIRLDKQYRRIDSKSAGDELQMFAQQIFLKTGKGRERVRAKIMRTLGSGFHLERAWPDRMLWVALRPRDCLFVDSDDPSDSQDCIAANYVMIGDLAKFDSVGICDGFWTIEFKDHALGRMFQRDRICDPVKVMLAAHHAILAADYRLAHMRGGKETSFHLPAGNGVFVCNFAVAPDPSANHEPSMIIQASTWLHNDMLDGRTPVVPGQEKTLGLTYLLPMPLRRIERTALDDPGKAQLNVMTWHDADAPLSRVQ